MKNMIKMATLLAGSAFAVSGMALSSYSQNFEGMSLSNSAALSGNGWVVYGNVFFPNGNWNYGYGPFPAPNGTGAFSSVATGDGGPNQGLRYINVFNDYNNVGAHNAGEKVEANVFQEQPITAADQGKTYKFKFDFRASATNGPSGASTTAAFIKVLNPSNNYTTIVNPSLSTTLASSSAWSEGNELSVTIGSNWAGYILQFGFVSTATSFQGTGVFYDNVSFGEAVTSTTITGLMTLSDTTGVGGTETIGYTATSGANSFSGDVTVADASSSTYTINVPSGTPAGAYSIKFKGGTFLSTTVNVIWTGTSISGPAVVLRNGNVDQDSEVGPGDFEAVVAQFGDAGDADCDNNGEVGPSDFEIVNANFSLEDQ